jgi:hypothetical protein
MRLETGQAMKRIIILPILALFTLACLLTPTQSAGPVQTEVAFQLTSQVTDTPTEMYLPAVATLVPPAVGAPTKMAGAAFEPEPTQTQATFVALPTLPRKPTLTPTFDPLVPPPEAPKGTEITYRVTGTAASVEIAIIKADGDLEAGTKTLPYEQKYTFAAASYLSLTARILSDTGDVKCEVLNGETVLVTNTASGTNQMATCVFVLPE